MEDRSDFLFHSLVMRRNTDFVFENFNIPGADAVDPEDSHARVVRNCQRRLYGRGRKGSGQDRRPRAAVQPLH